MNYELQRNLDQFLATGNPIYAWWAYRRARESGEPIPNEILQYLDGTAFGICCTAATPPRSQKERFEGLAKALGFRSKHFTDYRKNQTYARFMHKVEDSYYSWLDKYGTIHGWEDCELKGLAKEIGISKRTAERYYDEFKSNRKKAAVIESKKILSLVKNGGQK